MAIGSGLPGLKQGRAFTEVMPSVDVGAGIDAMMQATARIAGDLKEVLQPAANAEQAAKGSAAVTRDENGKLQVKTKLIFSEQDAAYMNAAQSAYISALQVDLAEDFREMRQSKELQLDPEKFRAAAGGMLEGVMSSVPSEFRGAVQQLFDREVARNVDDIADTSDRLRLQRQRGAVDASLKMAQNDVFALAMGGGLNTPEGAEATKRYISTLEMLRNPMWGISDEEIRLMADETLSTAKGMSAKGAVLATYRSKGFDAAKEYADKFFADPDLQLSPAQRESLKADALQEVAGLERERRAAATEARIARTSAMAAYAADLDVSVGDFVNGLGGDYADLKGQLDEARRNGQITDAKWAATSKRLNAALAKREKDTMEKAEKLEEGFLRVDAGIGFNPKDSSDREMGDQIFETWIPKPADGERVDEGTVVDQAVSFARHQGMVPTPVRDATRRALYSGAPDRQASAANAILRMRDANPMAAGEAYTNGEIERAQIIVTSVSNGMEPVDAVKRADDTLRVSPDVRETRRTVVAPMFNKGNDRGVGRGIGLQMADDLVRKLGGDPRTVGTAQGVVVGAIYADYEREFRSSFERTNDVDAARTAAEQSIRTRYGRSRFGVQPEAGGLWSSLPPGVELPGEPKLTFLAPEVVYGAGMPEDQAFEWQSAQLAASLGEMADYAKDNQGFPIDLGRPSIDNGDGTFSTEQTITVEFDGRFFNVPTIVNGQRVTDEAAVAVAAAQMATGWQYPNFASQQEAEAAASDRSRRIEEIRSWKAQTPEDVGLKSWDEAARLRPDPAPMAMEDGGIGYTLIGPNGKPVLSPQGEVMIWQPNIKAIGEAATEDLERRTETARRARADDLNPDNWDFKGVPK